MISGDTFSTTCIITNGQSVENFIGQLQRECGKLLTIKNNTIQILDDFPADIKFDRKVNDCDISKYYYYDNQNKYVFFKEPINSDMSLDSSSASPTNNIKKSGKKKITIIDGDEKLIFYRPDYEIEYISSADDK